MRKQGHAKADKKAARLATEGVVVVVRSADERTAAMVEINCETDFVPASRASAPSPRWWLSALSPRSR